MGAALSRVTGVGELGSESGLLRVGIHYHGVMSHADSAASAPSSTAEGRSYRRAVG